jgi:YD repeat-containing protein
VRATWNAFVPQNQFSMIYTYDVNGFKTSETDSLNTSSTWSFDYFGRLKNHRGMQNLLPTAGYGSTQKLDGTGTNYTYRYNFAGLLDLQTSDYGQNISFQYDQAGQLTTIQDSGVNRRTTYAYDQAGRHVRERVVIDGRVHQDTRTTYDTHNRIATLSDPDYQVSYLYDAAGNRTLIKASYANEAGTWVNQELYYTYDAANRVLISQGKKFTSSNGALTWVDVEGRAGYGPQGIKVTYNERGERVSATQQGQRWQYANGIWGQITPATGMYTEYYTYDGLGRLKQVDKETDNYTNSRSELRKYIYDKADRVTKQTEYFLGQNSSQQWVKQSRVTDSFYNAAGQIARQSTSKEGRLETIVRFGTGADGMGAAILGSINGVPNWSAGYDRAGILRGYDVEVRADTSANGIVYINQFRNYYTIGESYLLNTQQAVPDRTGSNVPLTGTTTRHYNVNEELSEFRDSSSTAQDKWRKFANNQSGQALTTIQQNFNTNSTDTAWNYAVTHSSGAGTLKVQHFFYADGKVIGSFGQLSPDSPNVFKANFDVNYTPISSDYPATTPATIVAVSGDTPRVIAARIFGDASLWYIIAQENLYGSPDEAIAAGSVVRIPNQVISLSNSGSVFKPFNPSAVLGDTNPTQPPPPPKSMQCRSVARIIGAVVSIIVAVIGTVYSWNPVFSGALGAAAGNRAEQTALLMLNGEYDYFGPIEGVIRGFGFGDFLDGDIGNMLNPFSDEKIRSLKERWTALGRQAVGYGPYRYWGTDKESSDFELLMNGPSELGAKGSYDRQATVIAAAAGAATAYVSQGVSAYDFAGSNILGAGAGAVAGYTTQQVVSSMFGRQTHWSWRDIATSALSAMVSAGVSGYAEDLGAGKFWSDVAGNASSVGVQMLRGGKKTAGEIFVDVFGNAIGNSVARSLRPEPTITERFGDAEIVDSITVDGDWIRASIRKYTADGSSYELVPRDYSLTGLRRDAEGNMVVVEERVPYGTDGSHDLLTNIMEPLRTGEGGTAPLLLADLVGNGESPPTPAQLAAMRMRVQRDINQAMYERTGRMPVGNLESYSASLVQVFGGDQSTYASQVNTLIDRYGLSKFGIYTGKFMKGFGDGFIGTFTEPVKMTRDLLAIPVDMIDNSWFGDSMQLNWWSSIGKAEAAGNVGTEGRILNVVGSVPILNIGAASYQGTKSFMAGDYLGMTEQGGSLAGGVVAGLATPGPSRGPRPSRAPGSDPSDTLAPISGDPASPNFVGPLPRREAPVQIDSGRGIFFIDDQILPFIDSPNATLGLPDKPHFFMPLEDSAGVVDVRSAYRETGGAPGTERALKKYWNTPEAHPDAVGDLYAVEFPLAGQSPRVPTRTDSGGFKHYTEGGHTALQLGDGSGFQINRTREFVIPGGQAMPAGSILYKIGPGGVRVPIRTWP